MTKITRVSAGSSKSTTASTSRTSRAESRTAPARIDEEFEDIEDIVDELEHDPLKREVLRQARQRIAPMFKGSVSDIASMRLRKGLSQKQLAEAIGTSQPHIARIENGSANILLTTANELARVLDVPLEQINRALGFPRKSS